MIAGGPAEVPPPEVADEGGMRPPLAAELRRFPFFDEQKTDPNDSEGKIFPCQIIIRPLCERNEGQGLKWRDYDAKI